MRHCKACDVHWADGSACWMCGKITTTFARTSLTGSTNTEPDLALYSHLPEGPPS